MQDHGCQRVVYHAAAPEPALQPPFTHLPADLQPDCSWRSSEPPEVAVGSPESDESDMISAAPWTLWQAECSL